MDGPTTETDRGRCRGRWLLLIVLPILFATLVSRPAFADKRVALVIGNSSYRSVARLDNPRNDAELLADTLRSLGFLLVGGGAQLDLDKPAFDRMVQAFGEQLSGAEVGLFYYAGHGVQVRGENYLIPVDANPTKEADVDFQMLDTNLVLRQMEGAGTRLNIVILDACRNNPFGGRGLAVDRAREAENTRLRDTAGGLAQMQAPEGTLISFATQPGRVAQDGIDGHSPYSKALADILRKPGVGIFDTFNQVGLEVKRATRGTQQPWVSSSPIDGAFYFVPPPQVGDLTGAPAPPQQQASVSLAAPNPALDLRRFDGVWAVDVACKKSGALPDFKRRILASISNGVFRGQQGPPGSAGGITLEGTIEADGAMRAFAEGISPIGKFSYTMMGRLEGTSGTGTRDDRDCDVKFTKQSAETAKVALAAPAAAMGSCPSGAQTVSLAARAARSLSVTEECTLKPKDVFKECDQCPEMVVVPAGSFMMGSPDSAADRAAKEGPQHLVTFARPFAVGKLHVTVDQFAAFVSETGYDAGGSCWTEEGGKGGDRSDRSWRNPGFPQKGSHPAVCLSWNDAQAYVGWLRSKTGANYRLLTEAEWEYAARAQTTPGAYSRYSFGDDEKELCRYGNGFDQTAKSSITWSSNSPAAPCKDGYAYTSPAGSFRPNDFGLYDMQGNAWQSTQDCENDTYSGAPQDGSAWVSGNCSKRILRGGGWHAGPWYLRAATRNSMPIGSRAWIFGMRVARTLGP
jgi:formylglycine-generating enzyme required for sulfatase activity/uncharacterized caspase-like protein